MTLTPNAVGMSMCMGMGIIHPYPPIRSCPHSVLEPAITMGEQVYPIHKLTSVGWRRCESDIHIHTHIHIHTMCIAIATATELLAREAMYSYPLTLTCTAPPVPRPLQYRFQLNCCSLTTILHGTTLRYMYAVLRCATVCCGLVWCVVWSGVVWCVLVVAAQRRRPDEPYAQRPRDAHP